MARKIAVEIVGDARSLERAFARSSRSATTFQRKMQRTGSNIGRGFSQGIFGGLGKSLSFIAGAGLAAGITKSVDAASDLNEQMNRSRVVFGRSAESITDWSKTTATALGLAQAESLEASSNFGAMFNTIGLGNRQAAVMSKRLTVLGADLASFNNQDPSEMLDRLRSGLAGEAEPLRRFGILLSEARVKQEAYRSGIAKSGATLTEQQKIQARYNLILRDSARQQGDFARTSGGLANQQRILRAQLGDLSTKLGTALLPVVSKLVTKWNKWLADPKNQAELIDGITKAVDGLATAIEAVNTAIGTKGRIDEWLRGHHLGFLTKSGLELGGDVHAFGLGRGGGGLGITQAPMTADDHRALARIRAARRRALGGGGLITGTAGAGGVRRRGITAELRNTIFDQRIARQLNRLQDLSLRKQLAGLRVIAQTIRAQIAIRHDRTRQLTLNDQLLDIYRQQRDVQGQITGEIKAANAALKDRADAIKSAILERLERRQATIENQRALRDARARLREALAIAGPRGARLARENLADVLSERTRQQLAAAPARLTRGGRFTLGNVITINIHGVTDPNAVAIKVDEILKKRGRRNSPPMRGPAAAGAGTH